MHMAHMSLLPLAVLCLAGCPAGAQGPAGPRGATGAAGSSGPAGAAAALRITAEPAGSACAAGGHLIQAGDDLNGNGVLDDSEITTMADVCDGATGAQGPAGATSAWQLVASDGFVFGQVTGLEGWLWNKALGGFLPKPVSQGTNLVLAPPTGIRRIYFANGGCATGNRLYIQPGSLGPEVALQDGLIPEPIASAQVHVYRVNWSMTPTAESPGSYMDLPTGTCTPVGGQVAGLLPLDEVGPVGNYTLVDRVHPGPATLQAVTVP